ncbi:hypothetical protein WM003_06685 [Klebsiella michiganensis]
MTKSTITRERLEKIKSWRDTYGAGSNVMLPAEQAEELARIALAVIDSEPVALQPELAKVIYHFRDWNEGFPVERFKADYVIRWMLVNYPPAQPTPVLPSVTCWSCRKKVEISAIGDCDGYCPECDAPIDLDEEPYTTTQPEPVIQVTDAMAYAFHHALTDGPLGDDDVEDIKTGLRAAFANVTTYQPLPVVLKEHQIRELVNKLRDIAIEYHGTQQLREHIACVIRTAMSAVAPPAPKSAVN